MNAKRKSGVPASSQVRYRARPRPRWGRPVAILTVMVALVVTFDGISRKIRQGML